jgi:hypothetical protein
MKEIHFEIKEVLSEVREHMKDKRGEGDILHYFQTLIHDAALIRQLLFSAQQALFEGSNALNNGGSDNGLGLNDI